jgi:hypothetical protein
MEGRAVCWRFPRRKTAPALAAPSTVRIYASSASALFTDKAHLGRRTVSVRPRVKHK